VKISRTTVSTSSRAKAPKETSPTSERSGSPTMLSGSRGTDNAQPSGFVADDPTCAIASTTIAMTVVIATPSSSPARTPGPPAHW